MKKGRSHAFRDRRMVVWTAICLAGFQLALNLFLETRHPEIYDPEYRDRLVVLQQRVSEDQDRPLLVVAGSSRITTDFRPEALPPLEATQGHRPLPFNFSHTGAGPLMTLMEVKRLERQGIKPRWIVAELVLPLLGVSGQSTAVSIAQAGDLPLLSKYVNGGKLYGRYLLERLKTCAKHQDACTRTLAPWMLTQVPEWDVIPLEPLGGSANVTNVVFTPEEIRRRTLVVRNQYYPGLQRFRLGETPDRAMRELVSFCRQKNIELVVLLTPESSEFRSWYAQETLTEVERYCAELSKEYSVPIVDARDWMPDDAFSDGQHLLPEPAVIFTRRLGKEVLEPLVDGRLQQIRGVAMRTQY